MRNEEWMSNALELAKTAYDEGEVPIGALLVLENQIVGRSYNSREKSKNPLDHAEMRLLAEFGLLRKNWRMNEVTMVVTLEPCPMCLGAILQARIGNLIYGCEDPKRNKTDFIGEDKRRLTYPSLRNIDEIEGNNHSLKITGGVLDSECSLLLKKFFSEKREYKV